MTVAAKCKYLALKQKCVSVGRNSSSSKEWIIIENFTFFCVCMPQYSFFCLNFNRGFWILHKTKNEYNPIFMTILFMCVNFLENVLIYFNSQTFTFFFGCVFMLGTRSFFLHMHIFFLPIFSVCISVLSMLLTYMNTYKHIWSEKLF